MKKSKRKKRKIRRIILTIAGIIVALGIAFAVLFFTRVKNVNVEGNQLFSDEQIENIVFEDDFSRKPIIIIWNNITGKHKIIPFVDSYKVRLSGLTSATIELDIKSMVGYLVFGNDKIYFNRDGLVVESTSDVYPDIPLVTGLNVEETLPGMTLDIGPDKLASLLEVKHFLNDNELSFGGRKDNLIEFVDRVNFDEGGNIELYVGEICVKLGSSYHIGEKMREMLDILPSIEGRSGTLHLEDYTSSDESHVYRFE